MAKEQKYKAKYKAGDTIKVLTRISKDSVGSFHVVVPFYHTILSIWTEREFTLTVDMAAALNAHGAYCEPIRPA